MQIISCKSDAAKVSVFCLYLGLSCSLSWASGVWRFAFPCLRERTSSWTRGGRNGLARWAPDAGTPAFGPSHEGAPVTKTSESIAKRLLHLMQISSFSYQNNIKISNRCNALSNKPSLTLNALANLLAYLKNVTWYCTHKKREWSSKKRLHVMKWITLKFQLEEGCGILGTGCHLLHVLFQIKGTGVQV